MNCLGSGIFILIDILLLGTKTGLLEITGVVVLELEVIVLKAAALYLYYYCTDYTYGIILLPAAKDVLYEEKTAKGRVGGPKKVN